MYAVGSNNCLDPQRFRIGKSSVPHSDRIIIAVQSISRRGLTDGRTGGQTTARQGLMKNVFRRPKEVIGRSQ